MTFGGISFKIFLSQIDFHNERRNRYGTIKAYLHLRMARRAISPRVSGGHLGGVSLAAGHGAGVRPADVYIPLRNAHCHAGGAHRRAGRAGEPRFSRRDGFPVFRSESGALSGFRRRFAHSAGKLRRSILPRERRFRRLRGRQPLENRQRHDRAHARAGTRCR